jgi:hypothetical protein
MTKSIHERVRAQLAKAEREAKARENKAHDARMSRLERADLKREERIDALIAGTVEPRNAEEFAIQTRALYGDFDE